MSAVPAALAPSTPSWLGALDLRWQPLVSRDGRPIGVRVAIVPGRSAVGAPAMELLASVLDGFVDGDAAAFPHGLVLLAANELPFDASLARWRPPRNVMLEIAATSLRDTRQLDAADELQRQGIRLVINVERQVPPANLPLSFQYVIWPASAAAAVPSGSGVLVIGADSRAAVQAAFANGAHAMVGWPIDEPIQEAPGTLEPAQKAVLELIRLLQAEADVIALERAFAADPVLSYLLLTLANSAAFRRGQPIGSIGQAITLLGYKRLLKWLVLLLVIASKGSRALPQIYTAVTRGFFMENLAEARRNLALRDDCFVTGACSLLARITGIEAEKLFGDAALPETVVRAVLKGDGPAGPLLTLARALEAGREPVSAGDLASINLSLLRALACADALQSLV